MKKSERAEIIRKELKKLYPSPPIPLDHTNAYTLLVAVVLSAYHIYDANHQLLTHPFSLSSSYSNILS